MKHDTIATAYQQMILGESSVQKKQIIREGWGRRNDPWDDEDRWHNGSFTVIDHPHYGREEIDPEEGDPHDPELFDHNLERGRNHAMETLMDFHDKYGALLHPNTAGGPEQNEDRIYHWGHVTAPNGQTEASHLTDVAKGDHAFQQSPELVKRALNHGNIAFRDAALNAISLEDADHDVKPVIFHAIRTNPELKHYNTAHMNEALNKYLADQAGYEDDEDYSHY